MELLEIESEEPMSREAAADLMHKVADMLAQHNEFAFRREGLQFRVKIPDQVTVEVELEIGDDESSLEIELNW
jgi:amphi-Trp domain-containing protein